MTSIFDSNGNKPAILNFGYFGSGNFLYVETQMHDGLWLSNK